MKAGKEYELLIEKLYKQLVPLAEVKHDDKIFDFMAETTRQIDVSIRFDLAGEENLIIIEGKDYNKNIDLKVIDQFASVIRDCKATRGIIVSPKRFSKHALIKAKKLGIECLSINSALKKNWETLVEIRVESLTHNFRMSGDFGMKLIGIEDLIGKRVTIQDSFFSFDGKNIVTITDLIKSHILSKVSWADIKKTRKLRLNFEGSNISHVFHDRFLPLTDGFLEIEYLGSYKKSFFLKPHDYLYERNYSYESDKLHELYLSDENFRSIVFGNHKNDEHAVEPFHVSAEIFKFNENQMFFMQFQQRVKGALVGDFAVKGNSTMLYNESVGRMIELENLLKKNI